VKPTAVTALALRLVMLMVKVTGSPARAVAGAKLLASVIGDCTVTLACAIPWPRPRLFSTLFAGMRLVLVIDVPLDGTAVRVQLTTQLPPPATSVPPANVRITVPAVPLAATLPGRPPAEQLIDGVGLVAARVSGSSSVSCVSRTGRPVFGLATVMVSVVVAPISKVDGAKPLLTLRLDSPVTVRLRGAGSGLLMTPTPAALPVKPPAAMTLFQVPTTVDTTSK